jgi:hypothetical protein
VTTLLSFFADNAFGYLNYVVETLYLSMFEDIGYRAGMSTAVPRSSGEVSFPLILAQDRRSKNVGLAKLRQMKKGGR